MPRTRIPSPARSQGVISTPRKHKFRGSSSVGSPARSNASVKLSSIVQEHKMNSFVLSPLRRRRSVLSDNTDIEVPGRNSWWKTLEENSRDVMEILDNKQTDQGVNLEEYIDADILSQEKKNYTVDLPESSDAESISSIVIPQRKLFTQKDSQTVKVFGQIMDNRESLAQLHQSKINYDKTINVGKKDLFNRGAKERSKPVFPVGLFNVSLNKTLPNKSKEIANHGQARNLFGNRAGAKRKNIFAEFVGPESEDDIPDIQPKVFGFSKNNENQQQKNLTPHEPRETSPTSDITDIEIDEWKLLPSSTMVDNQFGNIEGSTPVKRRKLNKLSKATEPIKECSSNAFNRTKQSTGSKISKFRNGEEFIELSHPELHNNNSKQKHKEKNNSNINLTKNNDPKNRDNIKEAASSSKSFTKQSDMDKIQYNLRMNKNKSNITEIEDLTQDKVSEEIQNDEDDDNDFILQYENDDLNLHEADQENVNNKSLIHQQQSNTSNLNKHNEKNTILDKNKSHVKASDSSLKLSSSFQLKNANAKLKEQISGSKSVSKNISLTKNVSNYSVTREINDNLQIEEKLECNNKQNTNNCNRRNENQIVTLPLTDEKIKKGLAKHELHNNEKKITSSEEILVEKDEIDLAKNVVVQKHNRSNDNNNTKIFFKISNTYELDVDQKQENVYNKVEASPRISQKENEDNVNDNNYEYVKNIVGYQTENQVIGDEVNKENNDEDKRIQEGSDEEIMEENDEEVQQQNDEMIQDEYNEENEEENYEEIQVENDEEIQKENDVDVQQVYDENNEEIQEDLQPTYEDIQIENNETVQKTVNEHEDDRNRVDTEAEYLSQEVIENCIHADAEDQNEKENQNYDINEEQNEGQNKTVNHETLTSDKYNHGVTKQSELDLETKNELIRGKNNLVIDADNHIVNSNNTKDNNKSRRVTLNTTHDKTGGNRQRIELVVESPEDILHYVPTEGVSFSSKGRNSSIRKTKSILKTQINIKPSLAPLREGTGISDEESKNSSVERSGWDSHRTTRKTLRQTFGKDFTPRKSLRTLVMENWAKGQTYGHDMTVKVPQACSTKLPENMDVDISEDDDNDEINGINEEINGPKQTNIAEETENTKRNNQKNSSYISPSINVAEQENSTNGDIPRQSSGIPNDTTEESDREMSRMRGQATYGHNMTVKVPQACSTKLPENLYVDISEDDDNCKINGNNEEINELEQTKDADDTENTKRNSQSNMSSYNSPSIDISEQDYSTNRDIPQQSSAMPNDITEESDHEMSRIRRQATLAQFFQKMKEKNMEERRQVEEAVRNSLKAPRRESIDFFDMPASPNAALRRINIKTGQTNSNVKQIKSTLIPTENLPAEVLEDMNYKPPRRYKPRNASWVTKRLYKFLEDKLEPK
ncbi:unnamed protein product [Parnassius apollo]|uniref:(apollo) hypothetical protein n=1 Tax=Parnassius apollo TaxID=110799 RepID=A0A8S3W461_PARAO|nr:unnamed protein product [Parnassius apollo]